MVEIIRKGTLPQPAEVPEDLREAATAALKMTLREPRPIGFPLLFSSDMRLIEPAIAFLHEHAIQRTHTADTVRTYTEILYDWFDALEQSGIAWNDADEVDLVAYRNRMLQQPSAHTGRSYSVRTVNHRVRGVLRYYQWAVRSGWLRASPLIGRANDFAVARRTGARRRYGDVDRSAFVVRQFEELPSLMESFPLFPGLKFSGRDRRLAVLRELAIKLLPKTRVGDERLRTLLPDKFHRVAEAELVDDHRPFELRHPQRIWARRRLVRQALAVADLAHQTPGAAQGGGDLPEAPSVGQAAFDSPQTAQEPRSGSPRIKATLENRPICAVIAVRSWKPRTTRNHTRRSGSKSGSGRWSHFDEIRGVHYPEILQQGCERPIGVG